MNMDLDRIRKNVAAANTEDLLDRATVYRSGMEPDALEIIDAELRKRNVSADMIQEHWENRRSNVIVADTVALRCSFCERPAITKRWGWHRLWGVMPVLPWRFSCCEVHATGRIGRVR